MPDSSDAELALNLADTNITITLLDEAREGVPLCNRFFRDFLHQGQPEAARVTVRAMGKENCGFPLKARDRRVFEQLLPTKEMSADLMTKVLDDETFERHRDFIMNRAAAPAAHG